ncbi:hypothetical protein V6N13_066692 [Hibiscus sabdariffa]|uniref:Pectinesterase n=1 Tax=Hibiscus sabdariffa TaxID=183260 RepID=A0ABR2DR81_9ROSI
MSTKADEQVRQTKYAISKTITVDQSGHGDFTDVQSAINSIPSNNQAWTLVHVKAGTYNEKVNIPKDKQKIFLQGESRRTTIIQFGDGGDSIKSTTFSLFADDFVAKDITFQNTYNLESGRPITWAPAALIHADKASFYRCGFVSVQDTLTDYQGRHYFDSCYIEGAVDFIWGNGQSIYAGCIIKVTIPRGRTGTITAQGRNSASENTGFVFKNCLIYGTGPAYLGRAYRAYSRVLFHHSRMLDMVVPQGWSAWNYGGKENTIVYGEVDCYGPGADKSKRVRWEKNLSPTDLKHLLKTKTFINQEGWLQKQPN